MIKLDVASAGDFLCGKSKTNLSNRTCTVVHACRVELMVAIYEE
jgi:hypothetical protein